MYFNTREYDLMNAISLMALAGASLSIVYLVCTAAASVIPSQGTAGSSVLTTHMWVAFALAVIFLLITMIVMPRYERLNGIKGLIEEFHTLLGRERGDGIIKLTPETQHDIVVTATRMADGYCIYIQNSGDVHRLNVAATRITHFTSLQCSTEVFAHSVLAFLKGDQYALRRVLTDTDDTSAVS